MPFASPKPCAIADTIDAIDWAALKQQGVRGILVDLDNTLVPWSKAVSAVPPNVRAWLDDVRALGFSVCLLSNGLERRVQPFARELGVLSVARAGKPKPQAYRRALALLSLPREACVAVGDQLMTDIAGAQRAGIRAFLVQPLSEREFFFTRINRFIERRLQSRASSKNRGDRS